MKSFIRVTMSKEYLAKNQKKAAEEWDNASEQEDKGKGLQFDIYISADECYIEDDASLHLSFAGTTEQPDFYLTIPLSPQTLAYFATAIRQQHDNLAGAVAKLQECEVKA